jgi:hypothetical protein
VKDADAFFDAGLISQAVSLINAGQGVGEMDDREV